MTLTDLGPTLQLRWLVVDDKGKAHAIFADVKRADAYILQDRIARRKNGL